MMMINDDNEWHFNLSLPPITRKMWQYPVNDLMMKSSDGNEWHFN